MVFITSSTSHKEIFDNIFRLREQKGKEKETLAVIDKAMRYGEDFVVNLFWEKALTYQHLVMMEDARGDKADLVKRKRNLLAMEETVKLAKYFIVRYDLYRWNHRMHRFLGRVEDYKGNFKRAASYYRKSIKYAKTDPEYLEKRYPRQLEVEAFLSFSVLMSGQFGKGHTLARRLYEKFDSDNEAKNLKRIDYFVWAVWKSGVPIRTINALLDKKVTFDKKEAVNWLNDAQRILKPTNEFSYRLEEIKGLRDRLSKN